ncbi:hypothetical protein [Methylobacterium sp. NEAU K]|uniref:DUF6894 family protein n=1 Tax=Methylobacterium sp. NEAU K TaxID=3064946 RepID=UPI002735B732|nr:hypothetical protein [Methylobacterium sp. NEAU K]MDP4003676.1 hypothetical protein [Methylobacterium sp. NEAU K]
MSARYFFDLVSGEEVIRDGEGAEAGNLDQALAEARSVIAEMADAVIEVDPDQPWTLIVRDEAGSVLGRLPIKGEMDRGPDGQQDPTSPHGRRARG